jgi:hypothetical protein
MNGPSRCIMCQKDEETIDHLLHECEYAKCFWENGAEIFGKTSRTQGHLDKPIKEWQEKPYVEQSLGTFLGICGMGDLKGEKQKNLRE